MRIKVDVEGLEDVIRRVKELDDGLKIKWVRTALVKGGNIVRDEAKKNLPLEGEIRYYGKGKTKKVMTGNLRHSIQIMRFRSKKYSGVPSIYVGPRVRGGYRGYHGSLVEFGTKFSKPHPYLAPAYESTKFQVNATMKTFLQRKLKREIKKRRLGR